MIARTMNCGIVRMKTRRGITTIAYAFATTMVEYKWCFNLKRRRTMIELKRCPFCGGEARVLHGGLKFMASVECVKCGATVKAVSEVLDPVAVAVQKWNMRSQNKALEGIMGYVRSILSWSGQSTVKKYMLEKIEKDAAEALGLPSACN